jgi:LuxR family maltose regulon positive regulatory protein
MEAAARSAGCPVVWVGLTERDGARAQRFWRRLIDALEAAEVDVITARTALLGMEAAVAAGAMSASAADDARERLVSAVLAALRTAGPLLLVLDDLDGRQHEELSAQLQELIEQQPPSCRAFVRTRHGCTLSLAHLLSSGRLVVLGGDALRLDPDEARTLVGHIAPDLAGEARDALVDLADGWLAALVAAARVAASAPKGGPFGVPDGPADPAAWLMDTGLDPLFATEVDALQPDERDLLIATSVLKVLTAESCDAVSGRRDSELVLARLAASGIPVAQVTSRPSAYRAHPLLAEHLRRRLEQAGPGAAAAAHHVAAEWYLGAGDLDEGMRHLVECGDLPSALDVLARHVESLLNAGRAPDVGQVYAAVPNAVGASNLHLVAALWTALLSGDLAAAEQRLTDLDNLVAQHVRAGDDHAPVAGLDYASVPIGSPRWVAAETSFAHGVVDAWRGYPAPALAATTRALSYFGEASPRVGEQLAVIHAVRLRLWRGDLAEAGSALVRASRRPRMSEYHRALTVPALSAWLAAAEGRVHRGRHLAEQVLDARSRFDDGLAMAPEVEARLARAQCLIDLDLLQEAEEEAQTALELADARGHVSYLVFALLRMAAAVTARGAPAPAEALFETTRGLIAARCPGSDLLGVVDAVEARCCLELGQNPASRQLAHRMADGPERQLLMARLDRERTLQAALRRVRATQAVTLRQQIERRILLASELVASRPQEAREHLLAGANAAHELGLHRVLVGWPEELHVLAERTAVETSSRSLTRALWVAHRPPGVETGGPSLIPDLGGSTEPAELPWGLSQGEVQLLQCLADSDGGGNAVLAEELGVSVNTIKTRLSRLYRKLDVHDRREALQRARQAGVLPAPAAPRVPPTRR